MGDRQPNHPAGEAPVAMSFDSKEWAERVADARARRERVLAARTATPSPARPGQQARSESAPHDLLPQRETSVAADTHTPDRHRSALRPILTALIAFAFGVAATVMWMGRDVAPTDPELPATPGVITGDTPAAVPTQTPPATDDRVNLTLPSAEPLPSGITATAPTTRAETEPKVIPLSSAPRTAPTEPLDTSGTIDADYLKNLVRAAQ